MCPHRVLDVSAGNSQPIIKSFIHLKFDCFCFLDNMSSGFDFVSVLPEEFCRCGCIESAQQFLCFTHTQIKEEKRKDSTEFVINEVYFITLIKLRAII